MKPLEDHTRNKSKDSKTTDGQDIPMRRLLFNAQVTAILYEYFAIRITETIVIPCLYLMNTSNNRNKVFQIGWKRFVLGQVRLFGVLEFFTTMTKISLPWKRSVVVASVNLVAFNSKENRLLYLIFREKMVKNHVRNLAMHIFIFVLYMSQILSVQQ